MGAMLAGGVAVLKLLFVLIILTCIGLKLINIFSTFLQFLRDFFLHCFYSLALDQTNLSTHPNLFYMK